MKFQITNTAGLDVIVEADSVKQAAHWLQAHYAPSPSPPTSWRVASTDEAATRNARDDLERLTHAHVYADVVEPPRFEAWPERRIALAIGAQPLWNLALEGRKGGASIGGWSVSSFERVLKYQLQRTLVAQIDFTLPSVGAIEPWLRRDEGDGEIAFVAI